MLLSESLKIGAAELASHKLRTFLTMLGVIFGVAAVVAVVAIGLGAREEALRQVELLGINNLRINKLKLTGLELAEVRRKSPDGLTLGDARSIAKVSPQVVDTAGRRVFEERVIHDNESPPCTVAAVEPGFFSILNFSAAKGRLLAPLDDEMAAEVCVLGSNLAALLFPVSDPIGGTIQVGRSRYRVVGVLTHRPSGDEGNKNESPNLTVYLPLQAGLKRIAGANAPHDLDEIVVSLKRGANLTEAEQLVRRVLHRRHNGAADYSILVPELLLQQKQATQRIFSVVLLFIAGLSLLVGGIGIMNIMLATVTQRTREIGVRRAIGATRSDILTQFLVEALLICLLGGLMGLATGYGLASVAEYYAGWRTIINLPAVVIAIAVSTLTGLVFGLYPSMSAARLDPIDALRYE